MGECDQRTTEEILDYYNESGGNFIDTANNYQSEESEQWIGQWMKKVCGLGVYDNGLDGLLMEISRGATETSLLLQRSSRRPIVPVVVESWLTLEAMAPSPFMSPSRLLSRSCKPPTSTCSMSIGGTSRAAFPSSCNLLMQWCSLEKFFTSESQTHQLGSFPRQTNTLARMGFGNFPCTRDVGQLSTEILRETLSPCVLLRAWASRHGEL